MTPPKIEIIKTDITTLAVDAIVNAANSSLLGGGGGWAIHRAAGPGLVQECRTLWLSHRAGQNRRRVIAALPVAVWRLSAWSGTRHIGSRELLASCYRNSLKLAVENHIKTIAFPAISCGVYGYPVERGCIAVQTVVEFLKETEEVERVILTCFSEDVFSAYQAALKEL
ncbi:MAG: macro domain-containing protein [Anaerolineae bacterium]